MDAITGTAGNDTINAPATSPTTGANATTINSGDTIVGGAGDDTLNITISSTNNNSLTGLTVSGVETVNISGTNNLGATSPALAAAQDAKALTAATLSSKNAEAALAAQQKAAADQVAALVDTIGAATGGVSANTNPVGEPAVVSASTASATTAAQLANAARAVAALTTAAAVTSASTSTTTLADGTSYTLAQYNAAALAALKGADGTTLSGDTAVTNRAAALSKAAYAVWVAVGAAASSSDTVEAQQAAATQAVKDLIAANSTAAGDALIAVNAAIAISDANFALLNTTAFTKAQYVAAATAVKTAFDGTTAVTSNAALATRAAELDDYADAVVAVVGDYTVAQLNAAATAALSSGGVSLLTAGNDEDAIEARADALAATAATVKTAADTAATNALNADIAAGNAVTVALTGVTATSISASQFADATQIVLSGSSSKTNVTGVTATQTIGFSSVSSMENSVTFGSTVTSGSVAVSGSSGTLTVTGASMTTLNVSGTGSSGLTIVDGSTTDTIKSISLSTSGSTVLTLTAANMSALTSVTQTGAGGLTLAAFNKIATVTTGAGADLLSVNTLTAADNAGTTIDETINASVNSGAGNDRLVIATTGDGKTAVDAGSGNDTIYLTANTSGSSSIVAGDGDDTVITGAISSLQATKIDGGAGTDALRTSTTAFGATEYAVLAANVSGVETLQLSGRTTALDASKTGFSTFTFLAKDGTNANTITEVSSSQSVVMARTAASSAVTGFIGAVTEVVPSHLSVASKGYQLDSDPVTGGNQTVWGDNLRVTLTNTSASSSVAANGDKLTMSVAALGRSGVDGATTGDVAGIATAVTLTGDLRSADVTLTSARGTGSTAAPYGLGDEKMAGFTMAVTTTNLQNMAAVKVSGAGVVDINLGTLSATVAPVAKLTSVDLSGMTAFANQNPLGQEWDGTDVGKYQNLSTSLVTLNNFISETVTLGGARDTVATGSTIAARDTITGFQLTASAADPLVVDTSRSDVLKIGVGFTASNTGKLITTASTLEAALLEAANFKVAGVDKENVVFNFGGNTYVYVDTGANGLSDNDQLVVLSGTLNLDLLVQTGVIIA